MSSSVLQTSEALFFAALPYRRSLYRAGGFKTEHDFDSKKIMNTKIQNYFSSEEIASAFHAADEELPLQDDVQHITIWDDDYPKLLRHIFDPPPVLFLKGHPFLPNRTHIAVVGTRDPHPLAKEAVKLFIKQLASDSSLNITIVSGLARGIDGEAHFAAQKAGVGNIAVLGSGVLSPGPASNKHLWNDKNSSLTLMSEFLPSEKGRKYHYPRRNRIIAGMGEQLILIQAPERSGSLISAGYALDEGREIFVFDHPMFPAGANSGGRALLQDGCRKLELPEIDSLIWNENQLNTMTQQDKINLFYQKRSAGELALMSPGLYIERG